MLFDPKGIKPRKSEKTEHVIDRLIEALTDPIVLHPSPWSDTLPQWVRGQIITERLLALMTGTEDTATDAEAMAYMYPAMLEAPLDSDWTEIYLHVATKTLERAGRELPSDIRVDRLDDYRTGLLCDLKRWIYRSRTKNRAKVPPREKTPPVDPPLVAEVMPLFAEM